MKKIYILLFIILYSTSWSQVNFPKSPEVNTLNKFDAIPTSDYTGSKGFEIPIYTITEGNISIPISLKYHASGIMIEDVSGKYGLGWALDIGGLSFGYQKYGKEDTHLWVPTTQNMADLNVYETSANKFAFYNTSNIYPEDSQPDIFSYGTLKTKGKFILDNKNPLFFPPSNIKLNTDFINNAFNAPNTVKNLTPSIVDTDGTQYFFNNPVLSYGNAINGLASGSLYNSINWEVSKIKLLNHNEIIFNYENNSYSYIANVSRRMEIAPYDSYYTDPYCSTNSGLYEEANRTSITDKVLKEILFPQGKIEFIYNNKTTNPREDIIDNVYLKNVNVYDKANKLIKTIKCNYVYNTTDEPLPNLPVLLTQNEKNSMQKRLILQNVLDSSTGKYTIDYYSTNGTIPSRLSFSKDHWGFYNGKPNNTDIPNTIINGTQYSTGDRKSDINFAKQFSIKSIQYPTGAKHIIDYELNDYFVNAKISKDTLLVKTLEDNSGFVGMSKTFNFNVDYRENYQIIFSASYPTPPADPNQIIQGENYAVYYAQLFKDNELIFSTYSPYDSFEKILVPGVYNLKISKTVHYNQTDNHRFELILTAHHTYEKPFTGNLESGGLRVSNYKIYDNDQLARNFSYTYKIPGTNKSSGISYPLFLSSILSSTSPKVKKNGVVDGEVSPNYEAFCTKYTVSNNNNGINLNLIGKGSVGYSYVTENVHSLNNSQYSIIRKYINHSIDNDFNLVQDPDQVVDVRNFSMIYDFAPPQFIPLENGTLLKETFNDQYGNKVKESEYEYEMDKHFNISTNNDLDSRFIFSGWLFSRKMHAQVPGEIIISNTASNNNATEMYDLWHVFKYNAGRYFIPSNWTKLKSQTIREYFNGQNIETKTLYDYNSLYQHFNPISVTTDFADLTSNITTHKYAHEKNNTRLVTANMIDIPLETENKKNNKTISKVETKYNDPTHLFPTSMISYDFQNAASAEVAYDQYDSNGNVLQYTTKDGIVTSIIWGYNSTQPIAKVTGVSYSVASALAADIISASNGDIDAGTEQTLIGKLDTFRKLPALQNAQISTYTYNSLIGVTSITPPSGIREIYKYDSANRLENIRDINGKLLKEFKYNYKH